MRLTRDKQTRFDGGCTKLYRCLAGTEREFIRAKEQLDDVRERARAVGLLAKLILAATETRAPL